MERDEGDESIDRSNCVGFTRPSNQRADPYARTHTHTHTVLIDAALPAPSACLRGAAAAAAFANSDQPTPPPQTRPRAPQRGRHHFVRRPPQGVGQAPVGAAAAAGAGLGRKKGRDASFASSFLWACLSLLSAFRLPSPLRPKRTGERVCLCAAAGGIREGATRGSWGGIVGFGAPTQRHTKGLGGPCALALVVDDVGGRCFLRAVARFSTSAAIRDPSRCAFALPRMAPRETDS